MLTLSPFRFVADHVQLLAKPGTSSTPYNRGGGWLTNVDIPTGFEDQQRLRSSLSNWEQVQAGLRSITNVSLPRPVGTSNSTLTSSPSSVQDPNAHLIRINHGNLPSHLQGLQRQNMNHTSIPDEMAKSIRQMTSSDGPLQPHAHQHPSSAMSNISPSRQRSMHDLTTSIPPPVIARPNSIPISNPARFVPPGLVPLHLVNDLGSGLDLRKVAYNTSSLYGNLLCSPLQKNDRHMMAANLAPSHPAPAAPNAHPYSEPRFVPMLAITRPDKTGKDFTPVPLASTQVASLKFSPRYHGMHTENNASVEYLKPEQNCALWLTNLPPDIKEKELLAAIRNVGRIYATYINYPDGYTHSTSAAKVVFFTPEAAQRLVAHATLVNPMVIRGHHVKIALNRIKYAKSSMENGESRVLIITGHKDFVNEQSLTAYFEARFQFQIDEAHTLIRHKERAVVEYKFGSYRCQAQMGMKALLLDRPAGFEMVEYGADPCEVGSDVTSFTVAGERIQGRGLLVKEQGDSGSMDQ